MSQFEMTTEQKKSIPWRLVLIFLFFSAAIILVGISFYNTQRKRIFSEYQNNLSDISSLKIRQIEEWRTERLGDAAVICQNEPLINCIKEYFADYNKPELKRELIRWMESVYKEYDYSGVLLVDTLFKVRLSIVSNDTLAGDAISKDLESVRKDHVVIMTDLHKANCINYVHLDLVIPLLNYKSNNPVLVGIAILRVDPQKALFPLVQSWPIPGKSSETLIVRKEGDSLLYLNELKYKHNSALKMKAPLSDQNLLGAKVVNGTKGFVEGIDYRNIPVVGYLTDIPGLKWFMVAKVDKDEIQAPLKRYLIISVIGIILLILINALVFGYWIWNQQVIFYRNQLKNENDIRESEEKFNTAFLQSPVSITISSLVDNNFIDVNNIFLQDSEYSRDEVIGHTANEIAIWADETERQWILNEISEKGKIFGKIIRYRSKTGRLIYGLTSMAVVKVNGESCNLSTVINITESIETEEKLRETNEYLSNLFSYANAPIIVWDKSLTVTRFNPAFEVLSGYSKEEVVGNKIGTLFSKEKTETSIDLIKSAVSGERWETVEIEIQRKDGDTRFVLWNSANILDKDGKTVVETIAQGQDITKRKKAEEELRESENKFRQTFDLSPVGIVMVGLDKRFLRCNNSFSQSLGYKPEELIGKAIADVTFHEDIELGMDDMMSILNEEIESTQIQKRYLRKDGNIVWGEVLISLVRDHKNQAQYFLAIIQDITERRLAEESLIENERKLREAQEMAHLGFWSWDVKSGKVEWSEEVFKIFNLDPEKFIPQIDSIMSLSPWDDENQRDKELINRAMETHTPGEYEQKFLRPDMTIGYYYSTFQGKYNENGDLLTIVGTVLDITERKNAEATLRESEDKFKYVFEHSVSGKSITLPTGELNVNKAFCEMVGYSAEELSTGKWQDITYPEDINYTNELLETLITGEKDSVRFTKRYIHKNGSLVWADVGTSLRRDPDGKPLYFMSSVIDITEQKKAESQIIILNEDLERRIIQRTEQLELSNKELEAFSYSVSHDLRSPLRAIHSFSNILLEESAKQLDDEGKRICGIISANATKMGKLIDDLLSFSRIGRTSLNYSSLDMKSLVKSVLEDNFKENITTKIILKKGMFHRASADGNLIRLVWINLISNAVKYSSKKLKPEVTIGSVLEKDIVTYYISDNGVGFDLQYKDKLFGVFQRLHSEKEFEGNGVGLAIVKRIILRHGGNVWAEGEEGVGATFYFSLPIEGDGQEATDDTKSMGSKPDA